MHAFRYSDGDHVMHVMIINTSKVCMCGSKGLEDLGLIQHPLLSLLGQTLPLPHFTVMSPI